MECIYIDWELIFKLIESLSIVIASIIAVKGINSWKNELKWKRKYELAEDVLANIYEAHQAIKIIRSSAGYASEGSTRIKKDNETAEETKIYNDAYVPFERYERNKTALTNLHTLKYRFIAIYGLKFENHFDKFSQVVNKVFLESNKLARIKSKKDFKEMEVCIKESTKVIYSGEENDDLIEKEIAIAKKVIEDKCREIIGKKN
jgi:hypothetical protein